MFMELVSLTRMNQTITALKKTLNVAFDQLVFNPQSVRSSTEQNVNLLLEIQNMKFVAVAVFLAFVLAIGVDSASVSLSSSQLTLNGNAQIQFYGPKEEIWAGLSNGNRYPILNSGDMIALRSSYPSGSYSKYWMHCSSSYCWYGTCKGTVMTSAAWSGCSSYMYFYIHAMGKLDGQPINSGDTVSISSKAHGTSYRLYCSTSTSYQCRMYS
ncbi:uncharacterized protein LOC110047584 isoform X1 [Orbicella faveolata]|uniref:uncharacterized protein LOC110047584 isoform X1 n=1 Tax=Orbicella faveolata TaxID=48498 RepID=UPI0009E20F33|nr:uncharacterized protein LOC110047584 isoform X1 [Orbicella faveolata]